MTGIDLTPANEAAEKAIWQHANRDVTGRIDHPTANRLAVRAVRVATPLIETAVREKVARDIAEAADRAEQQLIAGGEAGAYCDGLAAAARIARGGDA